MEIKLRKVKIKDLVKKFQDQRDSGVTGYGGKLDIRPPYQREFIYNDKEQKAVIDTVLKGYPLNVMYWAVRNNGGFEIIDGQQRTMSICKYFLGSFDYEDRYFHGLEEDEKEKFLDYPIMVYQCTGDDSEKLRWFETINIAGVELTKQELRNAIYHGPWVTDIRKYFSKSNCVANELGGKYMKGKYRRQEYLETVLRWMAEKEKEKSIELYMGKHRNNTSGKNLWQYYRKVIKWVEKVFPKYRPEMEGVEWGILYDKYKKANLNAKKLEEKIAEFMAIKEIQNRKGIYEYALSGDEKCLNVRFFNNDQKGLVYEQQKGRCKKCKKKFEIGEMEADHIKPWIKGGETEIENCQMLCVPCHNAKSARAMRK